MQQSSPTLLSVMCNVAHATMLIKLEYLEHLIPQNTMDMHLLTWDGSPKTTVSLWTYPLYHEFMDIWKYFLVQPNLILIKVWQLKKIRILNTDHDSRQLGSFEIKWIYRFCDPPWALSFIMVRTLYYTKLKELVSKTFV